MLPSCALCNRSDPRRMIALMALWFGRHAGLPGDGGYFYLCPACYQERIEPHLDDVLGRLVEQHPFLHRLAAEAEARRASALQPPAQHQPDGRPGSGEPPDAAA